MRVTAPILKPTFDQKLETFWALRLHKNQEMCMKANLWKLSLFLNQLYKFRSGFFVSQICG